MGKIICRKPPVCSKLSIELLKHMAMTRFSLVGSVSLLNLSYLTQSEIEIDNQVAKELKRLFAILMKLVLAVKNSSVHMFILRQIIHCYGIKDLQVIIEKSKFNWLNLDTTKTDDLVSAVLFCSYYVFELINLMQQLHDYFLIKILP